jgi:hypothetical protein
MALGHPSRSRAVPAAVHAAHWAARRISLPAAPQARHAAGMTRLPELRVPGRWPYRRVHAAACSVALRGWLGRWAVYALVAALVASAGAGLDSAAATLAAVVAWAALPLVRGAAAGGALALLATLGCAGIGLGLLVAMRQLIWPDTWREAERALPLSANDTACSDLPWIVLAAMPWATLQALGVGVWLVQRPAWLQGHEVAVLLAGVCAIGLTLAGGVALQRLRRQGGSRRLRRPGSWVGIRDADAEPRSNRCLHGSWLYWQVLFWWPMRRAVAPRFAWHTGFTLAASALLVGAAASRPAWATWWLALQALVTLAAVSRVRTLAALELQPLLLACMPLPLSPRGWGGRLDGLCAAPALIGALGLAVCMALLAPGARGALLSAWWLWLVGGTWLALRLPLPSAQARAARWLLLLAVAVALSSEVLP